MQRTLEGNRRLEGAGVGIDGPFPGSERHVWALQGDVTG